MEPIFLTAEWRHLIMLNYEVERELLEPMVPAGTVLDTYQGKAYVSVIGFLFLNTRLKGIPIPFHQNFEEVNLRFYVRHFSGEEWRRGVCFIKEIVPKPAITITARKFYNENYVTFPMSHRVDRREDGIEAEYRWQTPEQNYRLHAKASGNPHPLVPGSLEEFITEHYWGYARQLNGSTLEYQVEHPPWKIWAASEFGLEGDPTPLYGLAFASSLKRPPTSAFIAEGSGVSVRDGRPVGS